MDWRDKSVTLGNVKKEEFDTSLGRVTVTENRVLVTFRDVPDWHRIQREVDNEKILREVYWDEVEDLSASTEHLYYPHIDVVVAPEDETDVLPEKRIYFTEEEGEVLKQCLNAIRRFWHAWRQGKVSDREYHYENDDAGEQTPVQDDAGDQEDEEVDADAAESVDTADDSGGNSEDEGDESVKDHVDGIVDGFMEE